MNDDDIAILFCRPATPQGQSDTLDLESHALDELALDSAWVTMESVVDGDPEQALRHIDECPGRRWLYRGWMLTEQEYGELAAALEERGEQLNDGGVSTLPPLMDPRDLYRQVAR